MEVACTEGEDDMMYERGVKPVEQATQFLASYWVKKRPIATHVLFYLLHFQDALMSWIKPWSQLSPQQRATSPRTKELAFHFYIHELYQIHARALQLPAHPEHWFDYGTAHSLVFKAQQGLQWLAQHYDATQFKDTKEWGVLALMNQRFQGK